MRSRTDTRQVRGKFVVIILLVSRCELSRVTTHECARWPGRLGGLIRGAVLEMREHVCIRSSITTSLQSKKKAMVSNFLWFENVLFVESSTGDPEKSPGD